MATITKDWIIAKMPYMEHNTSFIDRLYNMLNGLAKKQSHDKTIHWFETYLNDPESAKHDTKLSWVEKEASKHRKIEFVKSQIESIPSTIYGRELIDTDAITQLHNSHKLPITKKTALMPDAHVGYGVPIGAVVATHKDYIIPYAVGSDIACRMAISIYDISPYYLDQKKNDFLKFLKNDTYFGRGCNNGGDIMDDSILNLPEWKDLPNYNKVKSILEPQLGTSGSGNHFVDWGYVEFTQDYNGIPAGKYVAVMTHSGSRGVGYNIADYYVHKAKECNKGLDSELMNLAWLDMNTDHGKGYYQFMNMAGDYASACHREIHLKANRFLKQEPIFRVENHHNFCWQEIVDNEIMNVHRKGGNSGS